MRATRSAPLQAETVDLYGRALRHAALAVLLVAGVQLSVKEIVARVQGLGRRIDAPYPAKALADALRYEIGTGRVRRTGRGHYVIGRVSNGMRYRVLARFGYPAPATPAVPALRTSTDQPSW